MTLDSFFKPVSPGGYSTEIRYGMSGMNVGKCGGCVYLDDHNFANCDVSSKKPDNLDTIFRQSLSFSPGRQCPSSQTNCLAPFLKIHTSFARDTIVQVEDRNRQSHQSSRNSLLTVCQHIQVRVEKFPDPKKGLSSPHLSMLLLDHKVLSFFFVSISQSQFHWSIMLL